MRATALIGTMSLALAAGCATVPQDATCDRDCLIDVTDAYIAALVAHDPSQAPLAADLVTVENTARIVPGEGLWQTADAAPTTFALTIPDPVAQAAGFLGMMTVNGAPTEVALRLQLENGEIVEAEHLVTGAITGDTLANLQTPRPGLLAEIPEGQRLRRDELVRIAGLYYDALEGENGKLAPFADDCARRENGLQTSTDPKWEGDDTFWHRAYGCSDQLDLGVMAYIDRLDNRRVFAADPVTGLTIGLSHFRHAMTEHEFPLTGAPGGRTVRVLDLAPFDLPAAHVYKIGPDAKIHEIEAMGFLADYNSPTGWE